MSELLKVILLSILQGIAEFLPISSSGHLVAAQHFLGFSTPGVSLELALHAGTLVSVCLFYFTAIRTLVCNAVSGSRAAWFYMGAIVLSMIPCGVAYAVLGDWLEEAFENIRFVGPALMATGLLLLTTRHPTESPRPSPLQPSTSDLPSSTFSFQFRDAFLMGLGQMVAMLPGVSRSGTTIWVARLCRVPPAEAARFSFLMSVPVIGGACLLDIPDVLSAMEPVSEGATVLPVWMLGIGALISAVVGYASLTLLVRMLNRGRFWFFGVYCLLAGLFLTLFH